MLPARSWQSIQSKPIRELHRRQLTACHSEHEGRKNRARRPHVVAEHQACPFEPERFERERRPPETKNTAAANASIDDCDRKTAS